MAVSMYQASVPRLVHTLRCLSNILDKAEAHAKAKNIDELALTQARLFPDMFALARQVQIACDTTKGAAARLGDVEVPKHEDTERTFAELRARIARTVEFAESIDAARIEGSEDRTIVLKLGPREVTFTGLDYLLSFVYPNFYFHVTTAYDILRHNGVEVGKRDYLGA